MLYEIIKRWRKNCISCEMMINRKADRCVILMLFTSNVSYASPNNNRGLTYLSTEIMYVVENSSPRTILVSRLGGSIAKPTGAKSSQF